MLAEDVIGNGDVAGGRIEFDGVRNGDDVLFDRGKEEEFLVLDGSAESAAHLMLGVTAAVVAEGVGRSDGAVAIGIEAFAVVIVGAGFGDGIDVARIRTADFGGGAVAHDLEFTDGQLREEVSGLVGSAAALAALEGVVKVHAVDGDVGVDGALAVDDNAGAVGFLHDIGSKLNEFHEVTAANGKVSDLARAKRGAVISVSAIDDVGGGVDGDLGGLRGDGKADGDEFGFTDEELNFVGSRGAESDGAGFDGIDAHGEGANAELALGVTRNFAALAGLNLEDGDLGFDRLS